LAGSAAGFAAGAGCVAPLAAGSDGGVCPKAIPCKANPKIAGITHEHPLGNLGANAWTMFENLFDESPDAATKKRAVG